MIINDSEKVAKVAEKYYCKICDYECCRKHNFDKHILTAKHKKLENDSKMIVNDSEKVAKVAKEYICECGKEFKWNSGLYRHKKTCNYKPAPTQDNNLILKLIEQQGEMMKMMASNMGNNNNNNNSHNTTNNTNQFNINVFLNEDCKNAINMSDFIKSIEVSLEQLDLTKTKGLEKGITQVIMDNMNKLSVHERPLHCTDTKRETLYIKEDDKWEKDKDKTKIKEVIKKASNKNYTALQNWRKENPDYMDDEAKQIYYAKAMSQAGKPIDNVDEKIIKNVCKQTYVKEDINTIKQ